MFGYKRPPSPRYLGVENFLSVQKRFIFSKIEPKFRRWNRIIFMNYIQPKDQKQLLWDIYDWMSDFGFPSEEDTERLRQGGAGAGGGPGPGQGKLFL